MVFRGVDVAKGRPSQKQRSRVALDQVARQKNPAGFNLAGEIA